MAHAEPTSPGHVPSPRIPRSVLAIGLEPLLRDSLARRADGRRLVIDAFRSWQCGTWVGDVRVGWWHVDPGDEFAALAPIEGVPVFAHRRLLGLLRLAGPTIVRSRVPLSGGLALTLDRPELWIDYLERPGAFERPLPGIPGAVSPGTPDLSTPDASAPDSTIG